MTKPKPCPCCGGDSSRNEADGINCSYTRIMVECDKCGVKAEASVHYRADFKSAWEKVVAEWNRRTPAPMTSVIEWTRYDGTPETLPEKGRWLLLKQAGDVEPVPGEFVPGSTKPGCQFESYFSRCDEQDNDVMIGDLWASVPVAQDA